MEQYYVDGPNTCLKRTSTFREAGYGNLGAMPLRTFKQGLEVVIVVVIMNARVMYVDVHHVHHLTSMSRG